MNRSVGTDPELALRTRKGTGYYKVPSLKGVRYRGQFQHRRRGQDAGGVVRSRATRQGARP
jgi:hypothetical protein